MNPRKHRLWWAFWIGVLVVLGALGWATRTVHSLEQQSDQQRRLNDRQELIRLALWRMDSRLTPIIALEAARPVQDYRAILGPQPKLSTENGSLLNQTIQDPLLSSGYGQGFFEIDESGQVRSMPARTEEIVNAQTIQDRSYGSLDDAQEIQRSVKAQEAPGESEQRLEPQSADLVTSKAFQKDDDYRARQEVANLAQSNTINTKRSKQNATGSRSASAPLDSVGLDQVGTKESIVFEDAGSADLQLNDSAPQPVQTQIQSETIGVIEPRWILSTTGTPELVLVRVIERPTGTVTQGVWLNWEQIRADLIDSIADIVPGSSLDPIPNAIDSAKSESDEINYRLATIPVAFEPGESRVRLANSWSPAMLAIFVTWVAVIAAMIAVGLVLRTVLNLSARRGRFVGAVTHELRTPLTTFRLYSQMLADGMVTDEAVRKEYLTTLKRESDRLTGIVENVLEYARISRQRTNKDKPKGEQQISAGELMARVVPPMSRLGEQSGMDLVVSDTIGKQAQRTVTLDPHAIERIMMNLMDNACKYAGAGAAGDQASDEDADLRVHLDASVRHDSLLLVVADHGPGVPVKDRRKIFGEFVRGSSGTMRDRSGLGLGLALSRGLAVEMGGDLSLVRRRGHGAEFELRIPLDTVSSTEQ